MSLYVGILKSGEFDEIITTNEIVTDSYSACYNHMLNKVIYDAIKPATIKVEKWRNSKLIESIIILRHDYDENGDFHTTIKDNNIHSL